MGAANEGDRLHYPTPNPYITSDFRLRATSGSHKEALFAPTIARRADARGIVSTTDSINRACVYFNVSLPHIPEGAFGTMLTQPSSPWWDCVNGCVLSASRRNGGRREAPSPYSGFVFSVEGRATSSGKSRFRTSKR